MAGVNLIFIGVDQFAILDQHGAEGLVSVGDSLLGEPEGLSHPGFIHCCHKYAPPGLLNVVIR